MIAYLDASVLLRVILKQRPLLSEWDEIIDGVSSKLVTVECFRTLERFRLAGGTHSEWLEQTHFTTELLGRLELVDITNITLHRAKGPIDRVLGTLDSIHLATAILYRERQSPEEPPLVFATHDRALGEAAAAHGFRVIGI